MAGFRRFVWVGATVYAALLIPVLFYCVPRMTSQVSIGIAVGGRPGGPVITQADPSTGLQPGDRILSIDGDARIRTLHYPLASWLRWPSPGGRVPVEFQRDATIRTALLSVSRRYSPLLTSVVVLQLLTSAAFFVVGIVMAWKCPGLHSARVGWLASTVCSLAFLALTVNTIWGRGWALPPALGLAMVVLPWHKIAGFWFASVFPSEKPAMRGSRALALVVFGTAPFYWLTTLAFNVANTWTGAPLIWLTDLPWFPPRFGAHVEMVMSPFVSLATCAVLVLNYRLSGFAERRRINWVIAATCTTLLFTVGAMFGTQMGWLSKDFLPLANGSVLLVPIAIGYAVVKHQVFGIRVAIRRSVQNLLARGVLEAAIVLPLFAMIVTALIRPDLRVRELVHPAYAGMIALAGVALLFRRQVISTIDQRFFRPAWDEEQMLSALVVAIREQVDFMETRTIVSERIDRALHPETICIVHREERGGPLLWNDVVLAEESALFDRLAESRSAVVTPLLNERAAGIEKVWLEETRAVLIVPIPGVVRLRGMLVLGSKKSEEPFTAAERKLLESVAAQMSIAHETHWLAAERVAAVIAERNRMARELHDSLAQGFAGISLHLQSAAKTVKQAPDTALKHVEQARQIARSSLVEARRSVHDLRSAGNESLDLVALLRELAEQLSSGSALVDVEALPLPQFPLEVTRNLFRIAQESVTNALKHAGATHITVSVSTDEGRIVLKVRDNGRGFDPALARSGGYGLIGMRERACRINGSVEIHSQPGEGTEVIALARHS